jgi:iron complex transport system permease protein
MALIIGSGLAVCGVGMQGVLGNPLADPYTTGISDGACLGAVAAIITGFSLSTLNGSLGIVSSAFICSLVPAMIIILIANVTRMSPATTILIGIALSYIFSGLETTIMLSADPETLKDAYLWQIGSLTGMRWSDCTIPAVACAIGAVSILLTSRKMNLLILGDNSAKSLGLDVDQFRTLIMILVSVVVAALVSFVGIIGFVGLIAPHFTRMIIGSDNRFVVPASMMLGSVFVLACDLISRTLAYPDELRVGLVISFICSPIFLYIIMRSKKRYGEMY